MKADAGGRELFSGFHFGMDDCQIETVNISANQSRKPLTSFN
jgi:hypothetical protein